MTIPGTHHRVLSSILTEAVTRRNVLRGVAGGLAIAASGALPPAGAAHQASPTPEPAYRYHFGDFGLRVIRDGWIAFPAPTFAINAPPQALEEAVVEAGQTMDMFALDLRSCSSIRASTWC